VVTPLITPATLVSAPTGIAWNIIPTPKATPAQQFAEQYNICHRASQIVDGFVNQAFRATVDTETTAGPNYYTTIDNNTGQLRWILTRWPVLEILAAQVAPNVLPPTWTQVPYGQWRIDTPVLGIYNSVVPGGSGGSGGQAIYLGAGNAGWWLGRNGYLFSASYINGWPHAGLTANADVGDTTITVDDVTGFTGAGAQIYDGANTEDIQIVSVQANSPLVLPNNGGMAMAGPGTLTLASGLQFAHVGSNPANVTVSTVPTDVIWATILICMTQALESGITAVSIQNIPGSTTMGGHGIADLTADYERLLRPYKRVI